MSLNFGPINISTYNNKRPLGMP